MTEMRKTTTGWARLTQAPGDDSMMSMAELADAIEDLHLSSTEMAEVWCRLGGPHLWLYLSCAQVMPHHEALAAAQDEDPNR